MDRFTLSYDYTHLSTFYADLVEYIVMTVRLYFFIREKQFRPIDREKYDELVGVKAASATLREEVSHMPPLTPEQQAFAEEHHGLILDFMEKHSLDDDYYGS